MKKLLMIVLSALVLTGFGCATSYAADTKTKKCRLNVATYNLRMDTPSDGENAWPHRKEMVKSLVRFYDFDIFGTQEAFKHMLDNVAELSDYAYIGIGRDDGKDKGEHSAIFYKKSRFEVLEQGNFWYSQTPDKPGLGWDAVCNRICTWGKFKDKKSGRVFYFFNSHFDHKGAVARRESAKMLLEHIKKVAGNNMPVIATGDFNAVPTDEPIKIISSDGIVQDSYTVTKQPPYGTVGTFNGFHLDADMKGRIDYIWTTKNIIVRKYGVLNDMQYGRFPSDHFPVMTQLVF